MSKYRLKTKQKLYALNENTSVNNCEKLKKGQFIRIHYKYEQNACIEINITIHLTININQLYFWQHYEQRKTSL